MKKLNSLSSFFRFLLAGTLLGFSTLYPKKLMAAEPTFFCGSESYRGEEVPTTYVNPETGGHPIALIYWVPDYFPEPPEERCSSATNKLQAYYDNGLLGYLDTDVVNGLPVICIAQSIDNRCVDSDIIVTLRPETDPSQALNVMIQMRDLIRQVNGNPLEITDDLIVYRNGHPYINLGVFVDRLAGK